MHHKIVKVGVEHVEGAPGERVRVQGLPLLVTQTTPLGRRETRVLRLRTRDVMQGEIVSVGDRLIINMRLPLVSWTDLFEAFESGLLVGRGLVDRGHSNSAAATPHLMMVKHNKSS